MMKYFYFFLAILACAPIKIYAGTEAKAVPGEYLVKLKKGLSVNQLMQNLKAVDLFSHRINGTIKSVIPEGNIVVIKKPVFQLEDSSIKELLSSEIVDYVEPNYLYKINSIPNDPKIPWGMKRINAPQAWNQNIGSKSIIVAVIDSGIDYLHEDLRNNMWVNELEAKGASGIDDDGNGFVDDIHGYNFVEDNGDPYDDNDHGSHCAGTIGAEGNNGIGIVGVNWKVSLMALRFIDREGFGESANAIRSIDYAVKMGAKVLSNSWGGSPYSKLLKEAIERADAAGVLFVSSAGNDGVNIDLAENLHYPSSYKTPNILTVGSIGKSSELSKFSNYGVKTVDVVAPGEGILSTIEKSRYVAKSGTSMSAPFGAGAAALIWSANPEKSHLEIKARIINMAEKTSTLSKKVRGGIINAKRYGIPFGAPNWKK